MFFDRVNEELNKKGFWNISLAQPGIYGYLCNEGERNSCIVFINLPEQLPENILDIRYSLEQVKMEITQNHINTSFLFVYLTEQPDRIKELCSLPMDMHWVIDRSQSRLIIYENQVGDFCGLREVIENALQPAKGERKKFTSYVTAGIVGVNILVYVYMYFICSYEYREFLIDQGGLFWPAVTKQYEVWRFVTSMFMHAGISHLFNNMLLLVFIGSYVEEYIGHVKFGVLYLASGILAGVVSMSYNIFNHNLVLSIGASGAIFGIVGALACFIFLSRTMVRDITGPRLVVFIGLSILGGLQAQDVDNMAHIGGLVSGFLIALIMGLCLKGKNKKEIKV